MNDAILNLTEAKWAAHRTEANAHRQRANGRRVIEVRSIDPSDDSARVIANLLFIIPEMVGALVKAQVVTETMADESEPGSVEASEAVDRVLAKIGAAVAPLTRENLDDELIAWVEREGVKLVDVPDDCLDDERLTPDQRAWLSDYCARADEAWQRGV